MGIMGWIFPYFKVHRISSFLLACIWGQPALYLHSPFLCMTSHLPVAGGPVGASYQYARSCLLALRVSGGQDGY